MFGTLFRKMWFRSAARKYAQHLPVQLQNDYGPGEFYTAKQIEKSAARAGLSANYIGFGYAQFMSEIDFNKSANVTLVHDYHELRSLLRTFGPGRPVSSGFAPASGPAIQGERPNPGS